MEAADKMGVTPERVFKTLAVGVVPVDHKLNLKRVVRALGARKACMAEPGDVERSTGYVLGGVSYNQQL